MDELLLLPKLFTVLEKRTRTVAPNPEKGTPSHLPQPPSQPPLPHTHLRCSAAAETHAPCPPDDCHSDCDSSSSIVDDGDDCVMTLSFRSLSFAVRSQPVAAPDDGQPRFIQIR
ncbi:Hypothetical predicted protein [Prunus dulcis]|uniref:Uncharacterized protein n=1 Tax=Prunus dulcis TaxID=3755 RepID=A0A5E4ENL8_PRUDU|nr:Hypothetical predicted protein [Prunus dulcis]